MIRSERLKNKYSRKNAKFITEYYYIYIDSSTLTTTLTLTTSTITLTTSTSTSSTCHPNTELDITPSPTILSVSTPLELEKGNHAGDARNLISIDIAKCTAPKSLVSLDDITVNTDPAKWIDQLLSRDIDQNIPEDFSVTRRYYSSVSGYRSLTKLAFESKIKKGKLHRKYLCYSSSKKALFCIPCRLFMVVQNLVQMDMMIGIMYTAA